MKVILEKNVNLDQIIKPGIEVIEVILKVGFGTGF